MVCLLAFLEFPVHARRGMQELRGAGPCAVATQPPGEPSSWLSRSSVKSWGLLAATGSSSEDMRLTRNAHGESELKLQQELRACRGHWDEEPACSCLWSSMDRE